MKQIQLNIAWMWDCDECGEENFERSFIPESDSEDMADLLEECGQDEKALLCAFPFEVTCQRCGETFETEMGR